MSHNIRNVNNTKKERGNSFKRKKHAQIFGDEGHTMVTKPIY